MIDWIATYATEAGLIFFFSFFVLMALWVYRPGSASSYKSQAHIPLNEDHHE